MQKEFDEIYRLYAEDVYRFLLKLCRNETLAEDILQDTMLKAVTSFSSFKGKCSLKTWLCTIARNEYLNHCKRRENKHLPLDEVQFSDGEPLEQRISDRLTAMELHKVLHRLEEPYKEIFTLRVFAELKFEDIGEVFGKSANWARVTFFRAKEKIITIVDEEGKR